MGTGITVFSVLVQFAATFLAFKYVFRSRRTSLFPLAFAILLMGIRRCYSLYNSLVFELPIDLGAESIALVISALMFVGLVGLTRWSSLMNSADNESETRSNSPPRFALAKTAILLGCVAIIASCVVGYLAYQASRRVALESISKHNLSLARSVAAQSELQYQTGSTEELISNAQAAWKQITDPLELSGMCIVGSDGKILGHSRHDHTVGTDIGRMSIVRMSRNGPHTFSDILQTRSDWVGQVESGDGLRQIVAFTHVPRYGSMVAIHLKADNLRSLLRGTTWPWVGGLSFTTFLLMPLSLGLLYWAYSSSLVERNRAELALAQSESRLKAITDHAPDVIMQIDPQGVIEFINLQPDDDANPVIGTRAEEWMPEEARPVFQKSLRQAFVTGKQQQYEVPGLKNQGVRRWFSSRMNPIVVNDRTESVILIARNVTEEKERARALEESEQRLRAAQRVAHIGSFARNLTTEELWWSDEIYRLLGLEKGDAAPKRADFLELLHPDDRDRYVNAVNQVIQTSTSLKTECRLKHASGDWRHYEVIADVISDKSDGALYLQGTMQDITQRKETEESQRESEQRFRQIAESIREVFWLVESDWKTCHYLSPEYENVWGRSCQSFYDNPLSWLEAIHEEDREQAVGKIQEHPTGARVVPEVSEYRVIRPDGSMRWILDRAYPVCDERGQVVRIAGIAEDVTDRKRTEEALTQSENRYRTLVHNAPICIHEIDIEGRLNSMNPSGLEMMGVDTESEIQGMPYLDAVDEKDRARIGEYLSKAIEGQTSHFEFEAKTEGPPRYFTSSFVPIRNEVGRVERLMGITQDITERRQVEKELVRREHYFRLFSLSSGDCFWNWDMIGETVERSSGFERSFGYLKEEISSEIDWWIERLHPDDKDRVLATFEAAVAGDLSTCGYEYRFRCRDGSYANIDDRVCLIRDHTNKVVRSLGAMHDITERKRTEASLLQSERRFRNLVEGSLQGICVHRKDVPLFFNEAWASLIGVSYEEALKIESNISFIAEHERKRLRGYQEARLNGEPAPSKYEFEIRKKDGSSAHMETLVSVIDWEGGPAILATLVDITDRIEAEKMLRQRELELNHISRVSTLGEMLAGVAHELGQPLYAISNYADASLRGVELGQFEPQSKKTELIGWIKEIENAGRRAGAVVKRLRAYATRSGAEKTESGIARSPSKVSETITEAIEFLKFELIRDNITVNFRNEQDNENLEVNIERVLIQQVLVNLIRNACEAMKEVPEAERVLGLQTIMNDTVVEIAVQDCGTGIEAKDAERVFETFFTTNAKGMGMGLSISRRIVESHGGKIWWTANDGEGVTFHFTVPISR